MHVVIPVAEDRRNPALRYAVDSIRRHTDHTPLTIGKDYGLCDHIPMRQTSGRQSIFRNTDTAMRIACNLGEPFIWSADDIYWLQPAAPIRWTLGQLDDATGRTIYTQRKHATADFLRTRGLPVYDYEAHVPLLIHPEPMLTTLTWAAADPALEKRSLYGNVTGPPDYIGPDVKIRSKTEPLRNAAWASTEGTPTRYPHLMERLKR